ncbi:MAG: GNAT family N-acetyltransferase [Akkermansiaceae bacterium]|nr:GNAT family N-acetyltransferase [Armatimonadota bacterium]
MNDFEPMVILARAGNVEAFEKLVRLFQNKAFAVALTHLGNRYQAEDAVQEAFIEVYFRLTQLADPSAFPAWLRKIVRGKCVRQLRSGKSAPATIPLDELASLSAAAPSPEEMALEAVSRQTLREAMDTLGAEQRNALLLYAVGGYDYAEIAGLMGLSLPLVKKRIYTARRQLRGDENLLALRLSTERPSGRTGFAALVRERATRRAQKRKETLMEEQNRTNAALRVELVGPGIEVKVPIKNLYAFYRYEMLLFNDGEPAPPTEESAETWKCGTWVNQHGVINGLNSRTHDEAVSGEDNFWEWPSLQAYLITLNGWPAGFAMVASPPNATPGVEYRLQEFFVINKARRRGVATEAIRQLFARLPGKWELWTDPRNLPASSFWHKNVPLVSGGKFTDEMIYAGGDRDVPGYVFTT